MLVSYSSTLIVEVETAVSCFLIGQEEFEVTQFSCCRPIYDVLLEKAATQSFLSFDGINML